MNEWGWNPSTFQAAGALATTVALFVITASFWNGARASAVAERESSSRTRPWLALNTLRFVGEDLRISVSNIGILPAVELRVTIFLGDPLSAQSLDQILDGLDSRIQVSVEETMVIFPTEEKRREIALRNFGSTLREKRTAGPLMRVYGRLWYRFGDTRYHTSFAFDAHIESDGLSATNPIEIAAI